MSTPANVQPEEALRERVLQCVRMDEIVAEQRAHLATVPWWRFAHRVQERGTLDLFAAEAASMWERLPPAAVASVARQAIHEAVIDIREDPHTPFFSTRNPFHREVLGEGIDALCEAVAAAVLSDADRAPGGSRNWGPVPADIRGYLEMLTPVASRAHVEEVVAQRATVADDPRMLVRRGHFEGQPAMVIQHVASGLRARFWWDEDSQLGNIYSKPYQIASIDPERPGTLEAWTHHVGLGIGGRMYRYAASLQKNVRWDAGPLSSYARHLRRRLHTEHPWRWYGDCAWCSTHIGIWSQADAQDFSRHPHPGAT